MPLCLSEKCIGMSHQSFAFSNAMFFSRVPWEGSAKPMKKFPPEVVELPDNGTPRTSFARLDCDTRNILEPVTGAAMLGKADLNDMSHRTRSVDISKNPNVDLNSTPRGSLSGLKFPVLASSMTDENLAIPKLRCLRSARRPNRWVSHHATQRRGSDHLSYFAPMRPAH